MPETNYSYENETDIAKRAKDSMTDTAKTVKDKAQFEALYAYSPYHHVTDGTKYPAILFTTGANDPRVDPMQSRKMTARLQAAQSDTGGGTVLLRTDDNAGHGMGSPLGARIALSADTYGFFFDQLGVEYKPVGEVKSKGY